jgi:16S rRNA processing protein RimM
MFDPAHWLEIGKIVAPQGLRGEMRVYPSTDFPQRFLEPGERWILKPGCSDVEATQLTSGRYLEGKGLYVISLDGIITREQAEQLRNSRLWVPEGDRLPLEEGEFHVADLIGLGVYHHTTGDYIGEVINILPAGHDILEVRPPFSEAQPSGGQPSEVQSNEPLPTSMAELGESTSSPPSQAPEQPSSSRRHKHHRKKRSKPSRQQPKSILIPFVYDIAPIVDLKHRRIEVLPPQGLIDL